MIDELNKVAFELINLEISNTKMIKQAAPDEYLDHLF